MEESTKLKLFRRLASVASKLKEFIGNMITTAGKAILKILLGSSGENLQVLGRTGSKLANDESRKQFYYTATKS